MRVGTARGVRAVLTVVVVLCGVTVVPHGAASAGIMGTAGDAGVGVERISVADDGTQADGNSVGASITTDGRRIVFASSATNLIPGETTAGDRVFLRDLGTGQTKRMGYQSPLQPPVISGDGEYLAYPHVWFNNNRIREVQVRTASEISVNCWYSCNQPSLSADGRYIALVERRYQPQSSSQSIEVLDFADYNTKQVIASFDHTLPSLPSISGDARYVAYQDGKTQDVFVWDRTDGTTSGPVEGPSKAATLVQLSEDGSKVVYLSGSDTYVHDVSSGTDQPVPNARGVAIDPTGRYLLYAPNDTTGPSLALRDLEMGTDETVSNQPASAGTDAVSAGGREVVFQSTADDIVPGDTNGKSDVFVRRLS
ncbi:TolB family protein [Streptomyces sp. NPDC092369]|uniref:TolB family protein n=1 Tax=Streptomyces sp. NPDC092369 TaxID=3366015 RepID=UPI003810F69A